MSPIRPCRFAPLDRADPGAVRFDHLAVFVDALTLELIPELESSKVRYDAA